MAEPRDPPPRDPRCGAGDRAVTFRVGIIGAGSVAELHLRAILRLPDVEIAGILDCDATRAVALAERFGLPSELVGPHRFYEARPQLVHVTAPPGSHFEIAAEALDRGVHVLVEKPPAVTLEACAALLEKAAARGVTIGVDENTAFDPIVRKAAKLISGGAIGRALHIDGYFSFGMPPGAAPSPWMGELPGGMLEDLLPHLVTTARALAGAPLTATSWRFSRSGLLAGDADDLAQILLAGEDRLTANLTLSLAAQPPEFTITIRGSAGTLALDLRNMLLRQSRRRAEGSAIARGVDILASSADALAQTAWNIFGLLSGRRERFGSPLALIQAHYAAVKAGTELPAPLSRAIETVRLARTLWPGVA